MAQGKSCSKCKIVKPLDAFTKSSIHSDGKYPSCRDCRYLYYVEYHSRPEVKERQREYTREYESRPDVREARRKRDRERKRKQRAEAAGREKNAETVKRWRQAHPEESRRRMRLANQKRKASKYGSESRLVTTREARRILASPCANCGAAENIQIDHIIPLSRGGRHAIGNLQPLCSFCNLSKNNSLQVEWKLRQRQIAEVRS